MELVTSPETRFLLKRFLRLILIAEDLATTSTGTPEDEQKFEAVKREIEVLNTRLQSTLTLSASRPSNI
jgi:hypothetical protein